MDYEPHVQEVAEAVREAFKTVADADPTYKDALYLTGISVDGQYYIIKIGVANVCDYIVEVAYGRATGPAILVFDENYDESMDDAAEQFVKLHRQED